MTRLRALALAGALPATLAQPARADDRHHEASRTP